MFGQSDKHEIQNQIPSSATFQSHKRSKTDGNININNDNVIY